MLDENWQPAIPNFKAPTLLLIWKTFCRPPKPLMTPLIIKQAQNEVFGFFKKINFILIIIYLLKSILH